MKDERLYLSNIKECIENLSDTLQGIIQLEQTCERKAT